MLFGTTIYRFLFYKKIIFILHRGPKKLTSKHVLASTTYIMLLYLTATTSSPSQHQHIYPTLQQQRETIVQCRAGLYQDTSTRAGWLGALLVGCCVWVCFDVSPSGDLVMRVEIRAKQQCRTKTEWEGELFLKQMVVRPEAKVVGFSLSSSRR